MVFEFAMPAEGISLDPRVNGPGCSLDSEFFSKFQRNLECFVRSIGVRGTGLMTGRRSRGRSKRSSMIAEFDQTQDSRPPRGSSDGMMRGEWREGHTGDLLDSHPDDVSATHTFARPSPQRTLEKYHSIFWRSRVSLLPINLRPCDPY